MAYEYQYEYHEYGSQPYGASRTYSTVNQKTGYDWGGSDCQAQIKGSSAEDSQSFSSESYSNYNQKAGGYWGVGDGMSQLSLTSSENKQRTYGSGGGGYDSQVQTYRLENQVTGGNQVLMGGPGSQRDDNPFWELLPSSFPAGTDQRVIDCYNRIDKDKNGLIDDRELQTALSNFSQSFGLRTVHLLMYSFTNTNARVIGPKEFVPLLNSLKSWKELFQRFDRDRNGRIDASEMKQALLSLGYSVPPMVLQLLVSKFDKSQSKCAVEYDNFIECCLTIKGLTEKFRAKENPDSATATFTYHEFLLSVLPFIIA
ncbi:hypothetical protein Nepgr_020541 [Nepenthes gracilis]|uniref:EF-hand domain-containing protein n=1 Tax=Nepenthes gracilis TaxID=150966 RepID=A0AAD3SX16_NEPGR|nr:hypothetical protein Nepgr_020541 [Nepenthes gracilis]